ncbi:MAG TPA: hypothetical protein VK469_11815, partial [Candidatus Kapabacteria bacterium]|nr:hypothetical protein [Candidatus Kapabacteria bacterium]
CPDKPGSTKFEARNSKQKQSASSLLVFVSDFGFRISDFPRKGAILVLMEEPLKGHTLCGAPQH